LPHQTSWCGLTADPLKLAPVFVAEAYIIPKIQLVFMLAASPVMLAPVFVAEAYFRPKNQLVFVLAASPVILAPVFVAEAYFRPKKNEETISLLNNSFLRLCVSQYIYMFCQVAPSLPLSETHTIMFLFYCSSCASSSPEIK
jgi:uncharacterized protein YqhQ